MQQGNSILDFREIGTADELFCGDSEVFFFDGDVSFDTSTAEKILMNATESSNAEVFLEC